MSFRRPFRQSRLTSIGRRLRYLGSRLSGGRLQKSQTVAVLEINGQRYKRIVLRDSHLAHAIEHALEAFGPSPHLPGFVIRYEHEVWVEFVDGDVPKAAGGAFVHDLALFYAHIYSRAARQIPAQDSVWLTRVNRDLRFLAQVGVLAHADRDRLIDTVKALTPESFWVGFDYNDPVLKNFTHGVDGVVCGIDVEALVEDQLLGLGVAKALMRWMEPYRVTFIETFVQTGAPDFTSYLAFAELSHLAAYTKLMFVERKFANVEPARFARFHHV
jgi:hypothetical protein